MPNSKNYSMREKILDGLLKRREGVSMQDIIRVVNHQLSLAYFDGDIDVATKI